MSKMLLILTCLACLLANVAARDVKTTLEPLYEKLDKYGQKLNYAAVAKFYHSQGVIVRRDESVKYGRKQIAEKYKELYERIGPHTFVLSNQTYQGTSDYMITDFDFEVLKTKEGPLIFKGKMTHIWKREDGKWRIYHEEYKLLK
ncbi:hypothetical protein V3C99_008943 [Haemonchus contortus]|uniref:DUF4440 domain-containing protein n=1 Tax=Haemonchus contortus TaxID=6289 RepID=A0A7I5EAS9_HAECO